jgi:hypothetical protein
MPPASPRIRPAVIPQNDGGDDAGDNGGLDDGDSIV